MTTGVLRFIRNGPGNIVFALALLLLMPAAARATSCAPLPGICFGNNGGTATGGTGGLFLDGTHSSATSTLVQIGNTLGSNLGTLSFTTGALQVGGSLKLGGVFDSGTFSISGTINGFTGVIFSGTFGPSSWVLSSGAKCRSNCLYSLTGPISGTWYTGITVSGETSQLLFKSVGGLYNGGAISLVNGSTAIVTPEPGTLGLMGTGLLGMGLIVRRKTRQGS